jgi:hypothetical protein
MDLYFVYNMCAVGYMLHIECVCFVVLVVM